METAEDRAQYCDDQVEHKTNGNVFIRRSRRLSLRPDQGEITVGRDRPSKVEHSSIKGEEESRLVLPATHFVIRRVFFTIFEGVPDVRQSTTYSCGAAALQALLSYWGIDKQERDLMQALKTSEVEGTSPEATVSVAKEVGCEAYTEENIGLKEIEESLRHRIPVICAIQAWADTQSEGFSWDKAWEDGHYVIVNH